MLIGDLKGQEASSSDGYNYKFIYNRYLHLHK